MKRTQEKFEAVISKLKNKKNLRSLIVTLAVIVVFTTTYLLVLPAFTLDNDEAAQQGGIDIAAEQTVEIEDQASPAGDTDKTDVKATDSVGEEAREEIKEETKEATKEATKTESQEAPKSDNKADKKDEVKLLTEKKTLEAEKAKGDDFTVSAEVGKSAKLPEDVTIVATELDKNNEDFDYEKYYTEALKALQKDNNDTDIKMIRFYDISLESEMLGDSVEPEDTVNVKIAFDNGIKVSDKNNIRIVHFGEKKTEVLDTNDNNVKTTLNENDQMVETSFETDGFSVYAVVDEGGGDNARMTVNFYNGSTLVKTMYVKNADDDEEELKKIIFDPGTGTIQDGWHFLGWVEDEPQYTANSKRLTIEDIRSDIKAITAANSITEGKVKNYYAAIYKIVDVTYLGDGNVALGTDAFLRTPRDPESFEYTVNMSYSPDATHNFEGWKVRDGGGNIAGYIDGNIYQNETKITISGSVTFAVNAPEGQWLVFHENKGTYVAPQFVKSGENTVRPTKTMERRGYEFDGWFADEECTTEFDFGHPITTRTHVYAGWTAKTVAPYTVICWTQNTNRTGYEVADSYVFENGTVGQSIPFTFVNNGDEDYVTGVGSHTDNGQTVAHGHYTGFCLNHNATDALGSLQKTTGYDASGNPIKETVDIPTIKAEGDSVLNLYFDRIEYDFRFYLYRDTNQNNRYDYANNSGNGGNSQNLGTALDGLVTWHSNQTQHPDMTAASGYTVESENIGGRTYHYFVMHAYYGEDISSKWPKYDQITGANGREAVSFVMMVGTKLKPNPTDQGSGTVKGVITVLNENILGATNKADGNYVIIRFPGRYYNWRYHIWFETVEGETYPAGTTHTYNGKTYYQIEGSPLVVRSSNTTDANQNEPKYTGFDYVTRLGQNGSGTTWQGGHWTTTEGGTTLYHLNYVYNRQKFKISYFDGNYVGDSASGEYNITGITDDGLLHESEDISFGAVIADKYKKYVPETPEGKEGFVFEGWYLDKGCTVPYEWGTMPMDGIIVYAKWHQKQYRAFLHPNAYIDDDPNQKDLTLDWGSDDQAMNFRVDYLGTISLPFGTRTGYEFIGWFTKDGAPYNEDTKLTDDNTVEYDKTTDMTDKMDKWGEGATWNSDIQDSAGNPRNRFWIEKKIDLYGRWRKEIPGAPGIGIAYDLNGGTGEVKDDTLYKDSASAVAQNAPTAPDNKRFDHWVVQTWNNTKKEYEDTSVVVFPGDDFKVLKSDSKVEVTEWKSTKDNTAQTRPQDPAAVFSGKDEITGPEGYPYISEASYTIQLKAVYLDAGNETPTHIDWYPNYGDNYAVHHDPNLQINQATNIWQAQTREGYKFLGWARVPTDVSHSHHEEGQSMPKANVLDLTEEDLYLTYNHDNGTWTFNDKGITSTVTKVAADEVTPYHDMYAVWEKLYTVKVKKVVVGSSADKETEFEFTPTGVTPSSTFKLSDEGTKEFKDLSLNTTVSFTEAVNDDFVISVNGKYKDADGNEHTISDLSNGTPVKILGDTEITFTNTRKAKKIKILKVDDSDTPVPLEGVGFTFNGKNLTTGTDGYALDGNNPVFEVNVSDAPYPLTETTPKEHYTGLSAPVPVTVNLNGVTVPTGTENVSVSGPDANDIYTIKVVNPRERYKVTVEKTVVGNSTDKTIPFSFTATGLTTANDSFALKDTEKKEYTNIPYGTVFSEAETQNPAFDTSIVITKGDGSTESITGRQTGDQTVDGDMTVKYTNTRNKQTVVIHKVDAKDNTPLSGAQFNIHTYTGLITNDSGNTTDLALPVSATPYTLKETDAPDGYVLPENDSSVTVSAGKVQYRQGTGAPVEAEFNEETGKYTVTVTNTAGQALPHTGGIGTTIFYVLGSMLVVGCGIMLAARRRMKSEEK